MATVGGNLSYKPVELTFGTSGLRGKVADMTDLECYINTTGFLHFLGQLGLDKKAVIYVAGDLRQSTQRILLAINKAIIDAGHQTVFCGLIPTPALALYAGQQKAACIMVTGSHIPDDRNGIKFYKVDGEVLKEDELGIAEAVATVRAEVYGREPAAFTPEGMLTQPTPLPAEDPNAVAAYTQRYTDVFNNQTLAGKKVVLYEHSSVCRTMYNQLLTAMGAQVVPVGRSEKFVPIDTENVTPDDRAYFKVLAQQHPDAFAIVSADGDADRPFVIDETGVFHRGDVLGAVVANWLQADVAIYPVSASDAVDQFLTQKGINWQHTKIGSPYVVVVMDEAARVGAKHVVGWEVNGGVLLGSAVQVGGKTLAALPTRDAFLPIIGALKVAADAGQKVSQMFAALPQRFTQAGLLDNFPSVVYRTMVDHYAADTPENRTALGTYFDGFGPIAKINILDGIRIYFENGDIAHMRLSSNSPQLRMYSVADTQERADQIVAQAIKEPGGIFRRIQQDLG